MVKTSNNLLKQKNKGFTLTELVIVIAVIAVLAAVLIPTFIGIANNAKVSADLQVAKSATTVISGKTELQDIYNAIVEDGNIDIFSTQSNGKFAYEASTRQFVLLNENYEIVDNKSASDASAKKFWFFVKSNENILSAGNIKDSTYFVNYFLCNDFAGNFNIQTLSSFETGTSTLNGTLNIASETTGTISLAGNIAKTVTLNIPNADVNQEGFAQKLDVKAVKDGTLNISGRVDEIKVAQGKVEVKKGAYVGDVVIAKEAQNVKVVTNGFINSIKPAEDLAVIPEGVSIDIASGYVGEIASELENKTTGESSNTIQIEDLTGLENFRDQVNAGSTFEGVIVQLTNNISLNGAWTPIGAYFRKDLYSPEAGKEAVVSFCGTFDGNGKKIGGLTNDGFDVSSEENRHMANRVSSTIATKNEYCYGLFATVSSGAVIKNLTIENPRINIPTDSNIYYGDSVGAVVGFASGSLEMNNVQVLGGTITAYDCVAGLVGRIYQVGEVKFVDCKNTATVNGSAKNGGLVGYAHTANASTSGSIQFTRCVNEGNIISIMSLTDKTNVVYAGGILGFVFDSNMAVEFTDCTIKGKMKAEWKVGRVDASKGEKQPQTSADAFVGYCVPSAVGNISKLGENINEAVIDAVTPVVA